MSRTARSARARRRLGAVVVLAVLAVVTAALAGQGGRSADPAAASAGSRISAARARAAQAALERSRHAVGAPGAQAAVLVRGRLLWRGDAGTLAAGGAQRVTPNTRFAIASVTKLAVAAMILRLADRHRLRIDDRVSRYVAGVPNGGRITLRMLLAHRSGLPDYFDDKAIERALADTRHHWRRSEVIAALRRLGPRAAPGGKFVYNDSNYVVLGGVIERVTHGSVERALRSLLLSPLGIGREVSFLEPAPGLMAHGHHLLRGAPRDFFTAGRAPADVVGEVWTDGGMVATATGLAKLVNGVLSGRVLRPATLRTMLGRGGYGLGVVVSRRDGQLVYSHVGLYGGFSATAEYEPRAGRTIVALVNVDAGGAAGRAGDAVERAIGG